jgi:isoleucyl-tRNA synthetase
VRFGKEDRDRWETVFALRHVVAKALEEARAKKIIGSSLEASVTVHGPSHVVNTARSVAEPESLFIVSELEMVDTGAAPDAPAAPGTALPGVSVEITRAAGEKCPRCWNWRTSVGSNKAYPDICGRCAAVMTGERK